MALQPRALAWQGTWPLESSGQNVAKGMVGHPGLGVRDLGMQAPCGLSEEGREKSHAIREILPAGVSAMCASPRSCGRFQNLQRRKLALHTGHTGGQYRFKWERTVGPGLSLPPPRSLSQLWAQVLTEHFPQARSCSGHSGGGTQ